MTIQKLREAQRAAPFRPFKIHTADGGWLEVPHPDYLAVPPNSRVIYVFGKRGETSTVDALLVTEIEFEPSEPASA
jgi:hypothetical protein